MTPRKPLIFGTGLARTFVITVKHFFSRSLTVQYPHAKLPVPDNSRGMLRMKGAIDETTGFAPDFAEMPPCQARCPANVDARGYIGLIAQGRYDDAYELHLENNPLPGIISRVCPHPCETACRKGEEDAPVTICFLKRFMADNTSSGRRQKIFTMPKERKGIKAAVVGSGPAGLSAAYYLGKCGYDVTIFERLPVTGGMLRVGIPAYRLPEDIIDGEVDDIRKLGVALRTNTPVGPGGSSLDDFFKKGFKAVFLGIGAHRPLALKIDGEHLKGVIPGEKFLADYRLGEKIDLGKRVAIVGGGNTAIDCARTALRMGATDVRIIYRRSRDEMPALDVEVEDAYEEGVVFEFLAAPVKINGKNKVESIELIKMELGPPDDSGRRSPVPIKGSEYAVKMDSVIPAISRVAESEWLAEQGVEVDRRGNIVADKKTGATSREGVYAAGDAATGPSIAIDAIGGARRAAMAIDEYLNGGQSDYWFNLTHKKGTVKNKYEWEAGYAHPPKADPAKRVKNFKEVEGAFPEEMAIRQAERCLSCMTEECIGCHICEKYCPPKAIKIVSSQDTERRIDSYDIDYGKCQLCRTCVDVCPTRTLVHTPEFETADYGRPEMIYGKDKMTRRESLREDRWKK
jgi:NADPH-dependent glutamate synthase beta subunit-like oxidoreductase